MMEYRAGNANEERSDRFLADGLGFVDSGSEPCNVLVFVIADGFGAKDVAIVDAHGEIDVAMLLEGLPELVAEEVGDFEGGADNVGNVVFFLGIDQQEAAGGVAVKNAIRLFAHFHEGMVIHLVNPCGEAFPGFQQDLQVLDFEIDDRGVHDNGTAVVVHRVDEIEIAGG